MKSSRRQSKSSRAFIYCTSGALLGCLALVAVVAAEKTNVSSPPLAARVHNVDQVPEEKAPWGSLRWLTSGKMDPGSGVTMGVVVLNVGQSNPLHVHTNSDEVVYVISGKCEQRMGDETVILKPGDTLRIPVGVPHQAKVLGDEPLKAIIVYNSGDRQMTPVKDSK